MTFRDSGERHWNLQHGDSGSNLGTHWLLTNKGLLALDAHMQHSCKRTCLAKNLCNFPGHLKFLIENIMQHASSCIFISRLKTMFISFVYNPCVTINISNSALFLYVHITCSFSGMYTQIEMNNPALRTPKPVSQIHQPFIQSHENQTPFPKATLDASLQR